MVKGITRRVVIIKSPDPDIFDEAIFLVKEDAFSKGVTQNDVLRQAKNVANDYVRNTITKKPKKKIHPAFFSLLGALAMGALWLAISLI